MGRTVIVAILLGMVLGGCTYSSVREKVEFDPDGSVEAQNGRVSRGELTDEDAFELAIAHQNREQHNRAGHHEKDQQGSSPSSI